MGAGEKTSIFKSIEVSEGLPGRDGTYNRALCNIRMEKDVTESSKSKFGKQYRINFCRQCGFVCPAGKMPEK